MKCNVCATENVRCYQLREVSGHPGMMMQGEGMIFYICSPCLFSLVSLIPGKTPVVETPEEVPITHPRVMQMLERTSQMHDQRKGEKPK